MRISATGLEMAANANKLLLQKSKIERSFVRYTKATMALINTKKAAPVWGPLKSDYCLSMTAGRRSWSTSLS